MHETGLTAYLLALLKHPDIRNADPVKAARKYRISEYHAAEYLRREQERRGVL